MDTSASTPLRRLRRGEQSNGVSSEGRWTPAMRTWGDVNGHHIAQKRNWQIGFFFALVVAIICGAGWYSTSRLPHLKPYVVVQDKVDHTVQVIEPHAFDPSNRDDQLIVKWALARFIENLRLVSFDPTFERKATQTFVEPYLVQDTQAATIAQSWNSNDRKQIRSERYSLQSDADQPSVFTNNVYQVQWTETIRNENGTVVGTSRWTSFMTVAFRPPNGSDGTLVHVDALNPLGLYIVNIDWKRTGNVAPSNGSSS